MIWINILVSINILIWIQIATRIASRIIKIVNKILHFNRHVSIFYLHDDRVYFLSTISSLRCILEIVLRKCTPSSCRYKIETCLLKCNILLIIFIILEAILVALYIHINMFIHPDIFVHIITLFNLFFFFYLS